jgi:alpha-L-rhamnosidase
MNSFNHYAYGAIGEWLYRFVAGMEIDPQKPGYEHVIVQPHIGGELTFAHASHQSLYGSVVTGWELKDGQLRVTAEIPANTSATFQLPQTSLDKVREGGQPLARAKGIFRFSQKGRMVVVETGSGRYEFSYPFQEAKTEICVPG